MRYLIQFQINIFAFMILAVLYFIIKVRSKVDSYGKILLNRIMIATGMAIILEPLTWIFDGMLFPGAYFLEYSTNFLLFMMGPIIGGLTLAYVDYSIFRDPDRIKKRLHYMHFSVLTFIVLIYNIFTPVYFWINPERNSFRSGEYKEIHYVLIFMLYIYVLYFILKNKKKLTNGAFWIFISFFSLPNLGMIVQTIDSRLHFSWTAIVLAILVIYIFLESTSNEEDYLTKLYNRKSSEIYINHLMEIKEAFGVVLFDLNLFKEINDDYGHKAGDQVLIDFSEILRKVYHKDALVARIGGDEFIAVIRNPSDTEDERINQIKNLLKNSENPQAKSLTFGYGYHVYSNGLSLDELYTFADEKMYYEKRKMKLINETNDVSFL